MNKARDAQPSFAAVLSAAGIAFFFLMPVHLAAQAEFSGRMALYGMMDGNVIENPSGSSSPGHILFFSADMKYPLTGNSLKSVLTGQFRTHNFLYYTNTDKSRTMNQLNFKYSYNISKRFAIQPLIKSEFKQYKKDPRNYRVAGTGFSTVMCTPMGWIIQTEVTRTKVYFPSKRPFNNLSDIISILLRFPVSDRHYLQASAFAGNHRYSKPAINKLYQNLRMQQRDNTYGVGAGAEMMFRTWTAHLYYNFNSVYSNSYGSSFSYHKIEAMALKKLGKGIFIKLYGSTQKRHYHDRVASADIASTQIGIDYQSAIAELGKKIGDDYEIKARIHWYRNQVLFTDSFFNRTVFSAGIERDF